MKIFHFIIFVTSVLISTSTFAQTVSNVTCHVDGQKVVVNYDIDQNASKVDLYVSQDGGVNYTGPLRAVSGDISAVTPGRKTITWDVLSEFDSLSGNNIVFDVRPTGQKQTQAQPQTQYTVNGVTYYVKSPKNNAYSGSDNNYDYSNQVYKLTPLYRKGISQRTWGIVLTSIGALDVVCMGLALAMTGDDAFADPLLIAIPFLAPGIPLWACGNKKMKQAQGLAYAPAFEAPIELGGIALVPSVGLTNDRLSSRYCMSAGLALRF